MLLCNCYSNCYSEDAENLLWTAPELLRMSKRPAIGTQKGDIYSFGVITQEIVTMTKPFGMEQQFQSPAGRFSCNY